jgi:hypothetical protein
LAGAHLSKKPLGENLFDEAEHGKQVYLSPGIVENIVVYGSGLRLEVANGQKDYLEAFLW